jgi:hypothetical protein
MLLYARIAPRRPRIDIEFALESEPLQEAADWKNQSAGEFARLSEPTRCDLVFAAAKVTDTSSSSFLERALNDPSESVVLAAAHALAASGRATILERFLRQYPQGRAARIAGMLSLLMKI